MQFWNLPRYLPIVKLNWFSFTESIFYCMPKSCSMYASLWFFIFPLWPDWTIYWTLGNFLIPWATINLPKSPTFEGNFCKGVKIYHFSCEIIFGQLLKIFGDFFWSHCPRPYNWGRIANDLTKDHTLVEGTVSTFHVNRKRTALT